MNDTDNPEILAIPKPPAELWMLWGATDWLVSVDDAVRGETFLAYTDQATAENAAEHQRNLYDCPCVPVRVDGNARITELEALVRDLLDNDLMCVYERRCHYCQVPMWHPNPRHHADCTGERAKAAIAKEVCRG